MGITDEAYGDALIKQQAFVAQQMKEKQMARTSAVVNDTNTITASAGGGGGLVYNGTTNTWYAGTGTQATPIGLKVITEENLQHDAMKAPLSSLVDMWVMRWQGEWVNEQEFDEDDFWRLALVRLLGANKLEKHNLANQYRSVYRIIE